MAISGSWAANGSYGPNTLACPSVSQGFCAKSFEVQEGRNEGHMMLDLGSTVDEEVSIGEVIDEFLDDCRIRNLASSSISWYRARLSLLDERAPDTVNGHICRHEGRPAATGDTSYDVVLGGLSCSAGWRALNGWSPGVLVYLPPAHWGVQVDGTVIIKRRSSSTHGPSLLGRI